MFAQVALPVRQCALFTYSVPESLRRDCQLGCLVLVAVGKSSRVGLLWRLTTEPEWHEGVIRPLQALVDPTPLFDQQLRYLLEWMSGYYLHPLGALVETALPGHLVPQQKRRIYWQLENGTATDAALSRLSEAIRPLATAIARRRQHGLWQESLAARFGRTMVARTLPRLDRLGLIAIEDQWRLRWSTPTAVATSPTPAAATLPPDLTAEQRHCVTTLGEALPQRRFAPFLLQGITGSGKTEVYFHVLDRCLALGRQVLLMVPEIALVPQLIDRFQARFQVEIAVFHSAMPPQQRFDQWQRIRAGLARVVIGTRSAIFAPFIDLGLIIVDEEHERSYKQEEGVPYHARDMAVVRAQRAGAVLLLASATPSLESLHNVSQGRYHHLRLHTRPTGALLPTIQLVDIRQERQQMTHRQLIGAALRDAMEQALGQQHQVLLFLNRRGYAPALLCSRCGHVVTCPNCTVPLTLHRQPQRLLCHYCDAMQPVTDICGSCGQLSLIDFGPGIEQLEDETKRIFANAHTARLDRDVALKEGSAMVSEILTSFQNGDIDILLGTQMVAKGHHFPNLALVGVVLAESSLCQPDFRAAERTFQLLTQVAGRAGREQTTGQVVIQSFDTSHYAIRSAVNHDMDGFAAVEQRLRHDAGYPPWHRVALIRFSCPHQEEGEQFCHQVRTVLPALAADNNDVHYLGPAQSPVFKLRRRFRWQLLVKEQRAGQLHNGIRLLQQRLQQFARHAIRIDIDVDPYS
ncbi:MAG: primosomal protein N', partial [Magnetococcales bacterium]|nr:primosomal protein N' [Magnetococcales bacterium]